MDLFVLVWYSFLYLHASPVSLSDKCGNALFLTGGTNTASVSWVGTKDYHYMTENIITGKAFFSNTFHLQDCILRVYKDVFVSCHSVPDCPYSRGQCCSAFCVLSGYLTWSSLLFFLVQASTCKKCQIAFLEQQFDIYYQSALGAVRLFLILLFSKDVLKWQ